MLKEEGELVMGPEDLMPSLNNEMLSQLSPEALEKYITDKALDIKGHKEHGREQDAKIAQHFLDQAASALALKQCGVKVA